jgi:lipopolysaccharide export system protein LptC
MTATTTTPSAKTLRDRTIERWRRRSRIIRVLRVLGPSLIAAILLGLAASVALNAMKPAVEPAQEANQPIRLIKPHFQGRDGQGRAFMITAVTATRDPQEYQKVYLDHPILVLDDQGPDPTRINSAAGIFHENTGVLEASGGVVMSSTQGTFQTATSVFDTKSGELRGSDPVQGQGPLGEISAKSYAVHDKGDTMEFHGRVHSVVNSKR